MTYRALLIGNSSFPNDPQNLQPLEGPVNDVALLRDALTDPHTGMFARRRHFTMNAFTGFGLVTAILTLPIRGFLSGNERVVHHFLWKSIVLH